MMIVRQLALMTLFAGDSLSFGPHNAAGSLEHSILLKETHHFQILRSIAEGGVMSD